LRSRARPKAPSSAKNRKESETDVKTGGEVATHTIQLSSGGTATLSMDINPITLSQVDREWLFGVVDAFQNYDCSEGEDEDEDASE